MKVSVKGKDFIKKWEGYRSLVYKDIGGKATVGWGHLITPMDKISGSVITTPQAQKLFDKDIEDVEDTLNKLVKVPLNQNQFDAVASLVFNWGSLYFSKSEGLEALNKSDFNQALVEFQEVNKVNGQVSKGLTNRRLGEAALFWGLA